MVVKTGVLSAVDYDRAAEEYLRGLPLEHFMEATSQATQREITVQSLALLRARRPDVQYFNELLVQYRFEDRLRQVVPDNMLVIAPEPSTARTNYAVELQAAAPFLALEYVSAGSRRKDYVESFAKYERELEVPYCILFEPEIGKLGVYRHEGRGYVEVRADRHGRFAIPELELEVGLVDGWMRFWHQGQLLELPAELNRRLAEQGEKLAEQGEELAEQGEKLAAERGKVAEQAGKITQLQSKLDRAVDGMRRAIERQAARAGRQDILDGLADTSDVDQLERWAAELERG